MLPAWVNPATLPGLQLRSNTITLRSRHLRWNGAMVNERQISRYLIAAAKLDPMPPLILKANYKDCPFAAHIERVIAATYPCAAAGCSQIRIR
jgi:hypothetical protein